MNETSVEAYLADGCGRCELYRTPQCKVHRWTDALVALRALLRASELNEEMKWGSPCYTLGGKNVVMLSSFKDYCALSFFKGALLDDERGVLERPGSNSNAARLLKFTTVGEVRAARRRVTDFIAQAIEVERSGKTVDVPRASEPIPEELQAMLEANPEVKVAFDALTPGRRRSYILHVSGAKQSKTRAARAERCIPKVLAGKGFNER